MKHLILFFIMSIVLFSCSESYKTLDVKPFNESIAHRADIKSPKELILLYYNYPASEGTPHLEIQTKRIHAHRVEITLIHSGLNDDSQSAEKLVMTAEQHGKYWTVIEIKENWKCWEGNLWRSGWGTSRCP